MKSTKRRSQIFSILTILVFVVVPFLFWRGTWFGTRLSESQMRQYLADWEKPRHLQHALSQIETEMASGAAGVREWYPEVVRLGSHPAWQVRITAAWVLGQDNSYPPFHEALLQLLRDSEPMVRRNAALALVRFRDLSGKGEILAMLRPYPVNANQDGTISPLLAAGESCERGALLARISRAGRSVDLTAPISGSVETLQVRSGEAVQPGQQLLTMVSDPGQIWEALRALYLIGTRRDIQEVARFTDPKYSERIRRQAAETMARIRERAD
ncbi:MAG: HEAT repeat domain-containing protein [Acidobacteria bacterium]|nr:HEAT repeat domain-containing protein [Acidobacteriota bacterium]